jgi:hypothetical protein
MPIKNKGPGAGDAGALKGLHERNLNSQNSTPRQPEQTAPAFVVTLVPTAGCEDPIRNLRHLLKRALRVYGLRCVRLEPVYDANDDLSKSIQVGFEAIRARVKAGGPGWGRT